MIIMYAVVNEERMNGVIRMSRYERGSEVVGWSTERSEVRGYHTTLR